ncbi:MAG: hypothetical protein LQ351_006181 [Letrouitia transgressa]|nr:MAG: hypothetical protein LQ351_006181 [Letrouitia transgressa]
MPMRTKVVMCVLTSLGIFDAICSSIVRTALLSGYDQSQDYTYTAVPTTIWATLELNFAILAACIPTLRPLFRFFDDRSSSSSKRQYPKLSYQRSPSHRIRPENQVPGLSGQFSLTSFETGMGHNQSSLSTEPSRDPELTSKTTDTHVII